VEQHHRTTGATPAVVFDVVVSHLNAARCIEHQPGKHAFLQFAHQKSPEENGEEPTYSTNSELIIHRNGRIVVLFRKSWAAPDLDAQ
jgi:hypothetical protein